MDEPDIQEALSKKAFTQWINQHLKKHIPPYVVNDIYKDLRSGVLILALYEQLTGEHLKYATGNNLGILDYIQNIDLAIHTLEKDGLSLGRIHASDIFEGKKKTINALLWNIVLYYEVQKQNPKLWETLLEERRKYSAKMEVTGESKEFATPQTTAFPLFPTEMFDFGAPRQFLQDWCNQNISSSFDVDSSNFSRSIKEDTILLNTLLKYLEQIFTKQTRTSHSHVHGPLVVHEGAQDNLDLKEAKCMYERVGEKLGLSTLNFDILLQKFDERSIVTYLIHYFQQYLNFIKQKMNEVATSSKTQHEGSAIGDNLDQLLESLKVGVYNLINQADPAISYIAQKEYLIWCKIMNRNSALYDNVRSLFVSPNGRDVTYLEIWNNLEASWIRLDQIKKAWSAELNDILFNQIYQIYFVGNEQMEDHDLASRATLTGSRSYDVIPRSSSKDNIKAKDAKVDSLTSRASLESSQDRLGQDLSTNRGLAQPAPSLLNINEVGIDTNANSASNSGIPDPGKAFKHDKSRHNNIKIDAYRLAAIYQFLMCHAKCKETFDLFNKTLQKYVQSNAEYSPSLLLSHHHTPPVEMSEDVIVCDPQLNENLKSLLTKLKNLVKSMDHSLLLESNKCLDAEWPAIINQLHTTVDDIEVVSNAWDVYKSAYNEGKIWLDNMESAQKITLDDIESHDHLFTEIDKYGSILAANCPQYTAPTFHSSFSQLIERWIVLKSQYDRCKALDQKSWFERTDSSKLVGLNRGENKHSFADTFEDSDNGESVIRSTSYTKKFQESVKDKEVVITKMNQRIFLQPVVVTSTPDSQEPLARNVSELAINQHVLTPIYQSFFDLESRVNPDASFDLYLERLKIYLRKCLEALQKFKEDPNTKANAVSQSLVNDKIENIHSMLEHLEPTETFELPHIEGKLEEWELFLTRNALSECKVVDVEGMWEKYKIIVDQVALPLGRMLNQLVQVYNKLITTFPYQNMDFTEFKTRMNAFIARYEENVKNSNRFDKSLKSLIAPSTKYTYLMDCVYKYIAKVKDVLQTNLKDSRDSSKKFAIKLDDDIYQKFLTQSERLSLVLSNSQRLDVAQKTSKVKQDWQACQAEINFATLLNNFKVHESRFNGYIDKALIELNYQTDTFKSGNYELNSILQRNTEYFASQKLLFPIKEDLDNMRDFVEEYQKNLDALKSKGENVYQLLNTDSSLMQLLSTVSGDSKSDLMSFHHQIQADLNANLLKWQNLQSKNTIFIKRLRCAISKRTQFTEKFDEIVGGANTIEADIENLLGYLKFQKDHHDIHNMIQDTRLRLENLLSLMASVEKMLTDQDYIQDVPESMQENDKANFETLRLNLKSLLSYLQGIVVTSDTGDQKSQSKERVRDALKDSQNTMIKTDSPVQNSVKINISAGSEDLNLHKKVKLGISSIDIGELEGYKNELKIKPFPDTFRGGDLGDKNDRYKTVSFTPLTKPVAEIGKLDQDQSSPHKSSIMMDIHLDEAQNPNSKTELFSHPTTSSSSQNLSNIKKQSNFTTLTKQIDPFNKFDDQYYTDSSHQPANETQDHQSQLSSEMNLTKEVDNGQINYRPNTKMQENSGQISSPDSVDSSPFFDPKIIPQGPKTADGVSEFLEKDDNKRLKLGKNADDEANDQASDFRVLASFKALKKGDLARMSFDDDGQIIQTRASFSKDVNSMEPKAMQKGVKGVPNKNTTTPLFDEISGSYENPDDKNKTKGMQKENKDLVVDKSVIEKKSGKTFFTSEPDDKEVVINVTDFMSLPSKINMNEPLDKVTPSTEKAAEDEQAYPKRYSMPEGSIVFSKFKEEGTKTDAGIVSCPTTLDAQKMEIDKSLSSKEYSLDIKKTPSLDKKETTSHDLNPLATIKLPTGGDNNKKNVKIRKDVGESQSDDFSTFSAPKVAFQGFKIEGANEILHKEDDRKLAKNVKGGTNDQANDKQILAFPEELEKGGLVRSTSGDAGKTLLTSTNFGKENKDDIMDKGTIESGKTHLPAQTVDDGVVINVTDFMTMPTSTNLDVPQEELSSSIEKFDEQSTDPKRDSLPEGAIVFPKFEEEGTKTDAGVVLSPITPEAQKEEKDKVLEVGAFPFNVQKEVTSNIKNNTLQDSMRQPLITTKLAQENLQMDNTIERDGSNIRDNNKTAGDEERRIEKTKSFLPDIRPWVGGVKISNTYPEIPSSNNLTETSQLSTPSQPSTQAIMQSAHATSGQEYLEQIPKSPESPFVKFYHQYPHDTFGSKGHVSDKTRDKLITNDQHEPDERKEPVDDGKKDTITPPNSPEDQSLNNFDTNLNTEAPSNSKSVTKDKSTADMMGGKLLKANQSDVQINKAPPESRDDDLWQLDPLADYNNQYYAHSLTHDLKHASSPREMLYEKISSDKNHVDNLYYDGENVQALDGSSLVVIKEKSQENDENLLSKDNISHLGIDKFALLEKNDCKTGSQIVASYKDCKENMASEDRSNLNNKNPLKNKKHGKKGANSKQEKNIDEEANGKAIFSANVLERKPHHLEETRLRATPKTETTGIDDSILTKSQDEDFQVCHDYHHKHQSSHAGPKPATSEMSTHDITNVPSQVLGNILSYKDLRSDDLHKTHIPSAPIIDETVEIDTAKHHLGNTDRDKIKHDEKILFKEDIPSDEVDRSKLESDNSLVNKKHGKKGAKAKQPKEIVQEAPKKALTSVKKPDHFEETTLKAALKPQTTLKEAGLTQQPHDEDFQVYHDYHHKHQSSHAGPKPATSEMSTHDFANVPSQDLENILLYKDLRSDDLHTTHIPSAPFIDETVEIDTAKHHVGNTNRDKMKHDEKILFKEDIPSDEVDRSKLESDNSLVNKKHGKKGAKAKQAKEIVQGAPEKALTSVKKLDHFEETTLKAALKPQTTLKEAGLTQQPHDEDFQVYHDYHHKHQSSHAGFKPATSEMSTHDFANVPSQDLENILSYKDLPSDDLHKTHIPSPPIIDETVEIDTAKHHLGNTDRDKMKHDEKILFKEDIPSDEVDRSKLESDNSLVNKKHGKKGAKAKQAKEIVQEAPKKALTSVKKPYHFEETTLKAALKPQTTPKEAGLTQQPHDEDFQVYHDYHHKHQSSHAGPKPATSEMSTHDFANIASQDLENILSYKDLRSDDLHKTYIPSAPIIDETVEIDTAKHHVGNTDRDKTKHDEKILFKEDIPSDEVDRSKLESDNSLVNKKHGKKGAKAKQAKEIFQEAPEKALTSVKKPDYFEETTLKAALKPQTTPKEAGLTQQPHDKDFQVFHDYHHKHQSSHAGPKPATSEMSTHDFANVPSQDLENILSYKDLRSKDLHKSHIPSAPIIDETVEIVTAKHHIGNTDRDKMKHDEKILFKEDIPSDEVDRSKLESDNSLVNKKHGKNGVKAKQAKEIVQDAPEKALTSVKKPDHFVETTLKAALKPHTTPKEAGLTQQPHDEDFQVYHDYHKHQSSHAGPKPATSEMSTHDFANVPSQDLENILSYKDLRSDDLHKTHIPSPPIIDETVEIDTAKHHVGNTDRDKMKHDEKILFKEDIPSDEVDRSKLESDNSLVNKKHGKKGAKAKQAKEIVQEAPEKALTSVKKPDYFEETTLKAVLKPQTTKEAGLTQQPHDEDFQVYHDYHHKHQSSHAGPKPATSEMSTHDFANVPSQDLENILSYKDLRSDDLHKTHIPSAPIIDETVEIDTAKHHVGNTDRDKMKHDEKILFKEDIPSDEVDRSKLESDNSLVNKKHGKKGAKAKQAKEIVQEAPEKALTSVKKPDHFEETTLKAALKPQTTPKEAGLTQQPHDEDFQVYHDYHHKHQSSHAGPKPATSEMSTHDFANVPSQDLENILPYKDLRSDDLHKTHIPSAPIIDETVEIDTAKHHLGNTDRDKMRHHEKILFKEDIPSDEVDRSKLESDNSLVNKKHGKKGAKAKQAKEIVQEAPEKALTSVKKPDYFEETTLKAALKPQTTPKEAGLTQQPHDEDFQVYHDYHKHQSSHAGPKPATSEMSTHDFANVPSQDLENILSYKDLRSDDLHKTHIPSPPIIDETVEIDTAKHHVGNTDRDKMKHDEKILFKEDIPSDEVDRSKLESDNSLVNKKHGKKGAKAKQAKEIVQEAPEKALTSVKKPDYFEETTLKAVLKPQTTKEAGLTQQPHDEDFQVYHDYHHKHQSSHAGPKPATSEMSTHDFANVPSQDLENILSYKDLRSDDLHKTHIPSAPIIDETVEIDTAKHHVGNTDRDKMKHDEKILFKEDIPSDEVDRSKLESDNSLVNKKHGKKGAKAKQAKEIVQEAPEKALTSVKKPDHFEETTLKAALKPQTTPKEAGLTQQPHDEDFQVYHDYHHKHQSSHAGPKPATSEMSTHDFANVPSQDLENILPYKDLRSDDLHKTHIPSAPIIDETVEIDTAKHHLGNTDRDKMRHHEKILFKEDIPSDEVDRSKLESDNSLVNKKHGKKGAKAKQAKEIVQEAPEKALTSVKKPDYFEETTLKAALKPQTTPKEAGLTQQPHDEDFQVYHDYHKHQSSHAGPKPATSEMSTHDFANVPSQDLENILSYKDLRSDDLHKTHIPSPPIIDETVEIDTAKHHVGNTDRDKMKHDEKILFKEDIPSDEVDRSKLESDNSLVNKKHGKKGAKAKQAKEIVQEAPEKALTSVKKPDYFEETTLKAVLKPQTTKEAGLTQQPHDEDFQVYHDYHHKHQSSHACPKPATSEMSTHDFANVPSQDLENILSYKDLRSDDLHKTHIPSAPIIDETVEIDTAKHHVGNTDRDKMKHDEKILFKEDIPSDEVDRSKLESDNSLVNKKHGKKGAKAKQAKEIVQEAPEKALTSVKKPDHFEETTLKAALKPQTTPKEAGLTQQPHDEDFQVYHDYHHKHQSSHAGPKPATSEMSTHDFANVPSQDLENILPYKDLRSDDLHKTHIPSAPIIDETVEIDTAKHHLGNTDRDKMRHHEKILFKEDIPSDEVDRSKLESDNSLVNKKHGKKGAKAKQAKEIVQEAPEKALTSVKKPDYFEETTLKAALKPQTTPKEAGLTQQPQDKDFQVFHDYHHKHQSSHAGPKPATSEMSTHDFANVPSQDLENILSYKDLRSKDLHKTHIPSAPIIDETVEIVTAKHHIGNTDRDKMKHDEKILFKEDIPSDEVDRSKLESDNSLVNKKHGKNGAKAKQAKEIVQDAPEKALTSVKNPDHFEETTLKAALKPQTTLKEAGLTQQPHDEDFQVYHDYHKHQSSHAGPKPATSEMSTHDFANVPSQDLENILSYKDLRSDDLHKTHIPSAPIIDETVEIDTAKHHVGNTDRDKMKHDEKILFKEDILSDEVDRSKLESDNSLVNKKHGMKDAKAKQAKEIVQEAPEKAFSSVKKPDHFEGIKPQTIPKEANLIEPHDEDYHDYHHKYQSSHAGPKPATSQTSTRVTVPSHVLGNILSFKDLHCDDLQKTQIPTASIIGGTIMIDTTEHNIGDTVRDKIKHEERGLFKDETSGEVARFDENIVTNLNKQDGSVEFIKHNDIKTHTPTLFKDQKNINRFTPKSVNKLNSISNFIDLKANKSNASSQDIVNAFRRHLTAIQTKEKSPMAHTSLSPSNKNTSHLLNTTKTVEPIKNINKSTNPHYQNASLDDIVKSYRIYQNSLSSIKPSSSIIQNIHEGTFKKPESAIDTLIESLKHPHSVTIPFDNTASPLLDADHYKLGESENPTSKDVNQELTMAITDNSKVKSECIATSNLGNFDQDEPRPDNFEAFHKLVEDTTTKPNQPAQVPFSKHNLDTLQHILTATENSLTQHIKNPINYSHILQDRSGAQLTLLEEEEKKLMTFSDDLFKLEEQLESIDDPSRKDHHSSLLLYVSFLKDKCEQILPLITRDKKHLKELLPRVKDLELTLDRGEALLSDTGLNDNAPKFNFSRLEKDFKNLSDTKGLSQLKHELSDYITVLDPVSSTILNDASKKLQAIQTLEDIRNKGVTTLPSEYENKDKEGLNKSSWINDLANKFSNLNEKLKTKYAQLQALSSNLDTVIPFVKKCETQNEEIQRWVGVTTNALDDPSKPLNDLVKLMPKIMKEREHLTTLLNDSANACNSICDPSLAITQKLRANITTNQKSLKDIDKIISQIVKRQTTLASLENEMANESKSLQKKIDNYEKDQYKNKSEFDALFKKSTLNPSDINQMYKLLDAQKKLTEDLQPLDAIISRLDFRIHLAISENKCVDKDVEPLLNQLNLKRKAIVDISKKGWANVDQLKSKLSLDFAERLKEMNPLTETTKQLLSELEDCPLGSVSLEAHKEKFRQINDNLKRLNALISDASQMYLDTPLLTRVQNGLMGGEDINEEKVLEKEFSVSGMKHDLEQLRNKISKFHDRHKVLETKFNDEMKDRQQYLEQLEALETNIVQDTTRLHSIDLGEDYDTVLDKLNSGLKPALKSYVDTYGPKLNELEKWASSNPQNMASGAAGKKTPLERIRTILVSTYEPTLTWANDRIKDEEIIGKEGETLGLETNFLLDKNIEDLKLLTDFIDKLNICHKTPKKLSEAKISPAPKLKSSTKALKGATPKSINDKNIIHGGQMLFKVAPDDLTPFDDDTGFGKDDLYEFTKNFNPKEISNIPEIVKMSLAKLNNAFESGSNNDKPLRPLNEEIGFNDVFTYLAHLRHMYTLLCQPLVKEIQKFSDRLGPSKPDRTLKNLRAELDSYRTKLDAIPAKFDDIEKQLVETLKTYFDSKLGALTTFVMDEVEKTDKTEMPKNFTNMDDLMDLRKHLIGKLKKIATANKVLDVVEKQCDEPKISGHMKSKIEALRALLLRSKTKYEEKLGGTEISVSKYWEASKNLDNFQTRYADFERKYKEGNQKETTLKDLKSSLEIFIDDINAFIKAHHDSLDPNATFNFEQMDSLRQKLRDLKSLSDTLLLNILNKIKGNGQKVTPEQQRVPKEKNVFTEQSAESQKTCAPLSPTMIERLTSYLPQTIHSAPPVNDIDFKDILKDEKIRISSSSTPFGDNNLLNYDTDDTGFGGSPQPTKMVIFENLDVKRDLPSSPLASPKLPLHINPSKGVTQEKQSGILNLRKSQPHKEQVNYDRIETIQRLLSTPTSPLDLGYNSPPHQLNLEALIIKLLDDTDKIIYEAKLNVSLKLRGKAGSPLNLDKNDDVFHFSPATPGDDAPSTSTFHEKYTTMERLTELLGQLKLAMRNIDTVEDILTYPHLYDATFTIVEPHNIPTLKNDLKNKYQELVKGEKNLLQKINSSDSLIDNPLIKEFEEDTIILRSPSSVTPPPKNGLFGRLLSLKDKLISPKTSKRNGFQSKDLDNSSDNAPDFLIKIKNVNFKDIESPIKEDLSLIENVLKNIEDQVSNSGPDSSDKDLNLIPDSKNSSNAFAEKQIKSAKLGRERKTSNAKARVHDKQDNVPFNQTYIYRVIRASLPLQALLLSLLGLACLLPLCNDDYSCALRNNLLKSMAPTLNYPDGPPPL